MSKPKLKINRFFLLLVGFGTSPKYSYVLCIMYYAFLLLVKFNMRI